MAKLAIALEIGGAVAASLGAAFGTAQGHIKKLEDKGNRAKVLKNTIGETIKLRDEWKKAHDSGSSAASGLLRRLEGNLDALKKQGVEVGRLAREYQRLGREAKAADLQQKGRQQIDAGKSSLKSNIGAAVVGVGMAAIPTKISADYQAVIRDIAIKADVANKPEEAQLTRTVIDTAKDTGMSRNDVADLVNQLVGAGMELDKALAYAPTAAKFAVGQGASGVDTASMIMALQQNAKITDPKVMQQALEAIAYQGQAGSFEASDMARWFPQLLAGMEKSGSTGLEAVTSLGSMLQVQMKTAGSSDEAANNFKNWIEKIGSGEVVDAYKKAGIDYQASLNTGIQKGMSTIESSMALALKYVEATDPAKAKKIKDAQAGISKEADPEKARAALDALEKSLRTGDLFADMQVKAALTAYAQNRGLYTQLKNDSTKATGILDKNLAERRETSSQIWKETLQSVDDSMRSVGDAIRPVTDKVGQGINFVARKLTELSDKAPGVVMGIAGITAGIGALLTLYSTAKIGRGVWNVARGHRLGRGAAGGGGVPQTGNKAVDAGLGVLGKVFGGAAANDAGGVLGNEPQRVFVVNARDLGGLGSSVGSAEPGGRRRRRQRRGRGGSVTRRSPGASSVGRVVRGGASTGLVAASAVADATQVGRMGRVLGTVGKASKFVGKLPGGKVLDAGMTLVDTALNAKTQDEKAEGYGTAAGGLAGALAGGAVGAAIGSVVPIIGTAIGGAIGAAFGGMGGEGIGGWLGKKLFGEDEQLAKADKDKGAAPGDVARSIAAAAPAPTAPAVAQALEQAKPKSDPPKVDQQFSYMPNMPITVQGDAKDPQQLFRSLEGFIRNSWDTWSRENLARQAAGQLFDEPHV
ncbi:phage tail tape measure protein [Pseudomonas chlororaphis]|uniref:phage tail tape measure protein n=1 Tax=Pseudomonas chlororaphis TaxID=587753 RepID=UPI0006A584D6|nr:phage tail tape measure protein [Pseudomonas chlororaphis]AZD00708.1 Phage protein [Pseudomonas chlororaphis subsp. chlororaphis]MBM0283393.1 phage tail tape measure protein [Pseudomonas chlororaphis]MDO1503720.1 phage tail tape measure protein [Pseudomonas chlororaphis]TWR95115.1 phage tail tape measure protein [Pseudomonas chlororaphis subsp. chlororaphis]WDG99104.1 phage tail tape measure protein [Pseudomonas chlororaphis]